jgi:hypothetical protein
MKIPDSFLICRVLNAAAVEGDDLVPDPQSRSLRGTARVHVGHNIGALRRLVRTIEAEFDGGRLVELKGDHPEPGVKHSGCGENNRQHPQRDVKPSRPAAMGRR